ncbi:hypothetical protein HY045_02205 [Candidatus Woesebacteria bacterium]|nr:hypothetical protein [Candidatus Woesebacteria bacterium]
MKKPPAQTYQDEEKIKIPFESFRSKLKLKSLQARQDLKIRHPYVEKFFTDRGLQLDKIRQHSAKIISAGTMTGTLLLTPPQITSTLPSPAELLNKLTLNDPVSVSPQKAALDALRQLLPERPRPLTRDEEKTLEKLIESVVGVKAKAALEGEHLNTTYGYIGAEQHLYRYLGDTLDLHGSGMVLQEGIAPGLGAWGYFAPTKAKLTPDLVETEKWYAVVQTLYLPDWSKRQPYLRDWYKYRKVLIVNTVNGNTVVASIADSGPAAWTGKQFGGSPEVMDYLGGPRYKKGAVLVFFVDDPENKVPLGPVEYNKLNIPESSLVQI